jgi:hypothetical protein
MLGIVEKFKIHKEAIIKKIESEMQGEDSVDKLIEELKKITIEIVDEKNDKYKEGLEECLKYSDSFIYTIVKITPNSLFAHRPFRPPLISLSLW